MAFSLSDLVLHLAFQIFNLRISKYRFEKVHIACISSSQV